LKIDLEKIDSNLYSKSVSNILKLVSDPWRPPYKYNLSSLSLIAIKDWKLDSCGKDRPQSIKFQVLVFRLKQYKSFKSEFPSNPPKIKKESLSDKHMECPALADGIFPLFGTFFQCLWFIS
jgi:hypothetical protein